VLVAALALQTAASSAQSPTPTPDQSAVAAANNAFAVDLYTQLRTQPGNLFFSPESISTALAMTYAGARGDTASEMARTLHFTLPPERLHPAMGALLANLNAAHDGYQLRVADALWAQRDYTFLDDFLKLTRDNYGAGLKKVDFKGAAEAARGTINQWVAQKTEDKIKDLIGPGVLDRRTRLVLTNAIYFKGDWETQFDKSQTKAENFHITPSQSIQSPLMHREGGFSYFDGGTFQALEIPYKSKELSMVIFLPREIDGLSALEQSVTPAGMKQWLGQLRPVPKVILTLPAFRMTRQFGLGGTLAAMGMPTAFGAGADFSGMTGERDLFISAVIHKAFIDVNEEGTEAAAATAVTMTRAMAVRVAPPPPPVFRADHPFIFVIRDNRSGAVLFMGRLTDPSK
jgi:serpin B